MTERDKNAPTNFGSESSMAAAVAKAKAQKVPLGGVPMPIMPRLDQPIPNAQAGVQSVRAAKRILTPEEQQKLSEAGKFIPGVGSAYAVNQPAVGLLDNKEEEPEIDPRTAPRPPGSGLSPETVRGLEAVAAANAGKEEREADDKLKKDIEAADDVFETNEFGERVRSLLANKKRKETIENRCLPMAFEDLLLTGSVKQVVPIIPGKFEPTFRSLQGDENVEILRLIGLKNGPDEYLLDLLSIYRLTAGLYSINGRLLPNHLDKESSFDEDTFLGKYKVVVRMALPVLADLVVNYGWFSRRVQKLTVVDDIKGF